MGATKETIDIDVVRHNYLLDLERDHQKRVEHDWAVASICVQAGTRFCFKEYPDILYTVLGNGTRKNGDVFLVCGCDHASREPSIVCLDAKEIVDDDYETVQWMK
jgi:hypothetical protein